MISISDLERDYNSYTEFVKNRVALTETDYSAKIKLIYKKTFILSKILNNFYSYEDNHIIEQSKQLKSSIIISFDLINLNYLVASKQILRTVIESSFRLFLSITRYNLYIERKEAGKYHATDEMKKIKSTVDSHKIRRLTNYTRELFSETILGNIIDNLNDFYTDYSAYVHGDFKKDSTLQIHLAEYLLYDNHEIETHLEQFQKIIEYMLIFLYWQDNSLFHRNDLFILEEGACSKVKLVLSNISEI